MIYEWTCRCGKIVEVNRPMAESDVPPARCPECGETAKFKRRYNSAGFVLKGTGWFKKGGY